MVDCYLLIVFGVVVGAEDEAGVGVGEGQSGLMLMMWWGWVMGGY